MLKLKCTLIDRRDNMVKNLKVTYTPKGRAAEYSEYALNIYNGCNFGCKYCFAPLV